MWPERELNNPGGQEQLPIVANQNVKASVDYE
jgi:hypothetical protein